MTLPAEIESGNKEYKLKVIPKNEFRKEQLASQMKWRLQEGEGIALYYIGVWDNGKIEGLNKTDYEITLSNLKEIAEIIQAEVVNIKENLYNEKKWYILKIQFKSNKKNSLRVIFIGPSNSGKTTLISNLCNKMTDNGKGKSRKLIFNHKHEIYSGRTSSVVVEKYEVQNCDTYFNFIDTPGYIKYFKTTITALCKYNPNIIMLCIDPLEIDIQQLTFYLEILKYFKKKFYIILTKKDKYKQIHKNYLTKNILNICGKDFSLENIKLIPLIEVNNLNKSGYIKINKILKKFKLKKLFHQDKFLLQICDVIKIPNFGKVYTGIIIRGRLNKKKDYYLISPEYQKKIKLKSIYYMNKPIDIVESKNIVTFTLNEDLTTTNKTDMIILESKSKIFTRKIKIKCQKNIDETQGICLYNNQYCSVKIKKLKNNIYELEKEDHFINLSKNIILKLNSGYYFSELQK